LTDGGLVDVDAVRLRDTSTEEGAVRLAWGKAVWQVAEHEDNA